MTMNVALLFLNVVKMLISSSISWWSLSIFNNKPISGSYCTMLPSLSSASITSHSPAPTFALPIFPSLIILTNPAPLMMLGCKPALSKISNNMALVVLLPDVPPTAMVLLLLAMSASNSDRLMIGMLSCFAFCTSNTVSSMAVETTTRSVPVVMPSPFCKKHCMPAASSFSLVLLNSPSLKYRSLPLTFLSIPARYCAMALMPTPATPMKKTFLKSWIPVIIKQDFV